jgi:hypothetical protein
MMGSDPGEIEVKMQRYYKLKLKCNDTISCCQRRMAGYGWRLKP